MATIDNETGNVVYPTDNPDIVKERVQPGQSLPLYSTLARDSAGQEWAYYPTEAALRMGKVIAAMDTITGLPDQIANQVGTVIDTGREIVRGVPSAVLIAGGLFLAYEIFMRKAGR